jgi:hypothetical protein
LRDDVKIECLETWTEDARLHFGEEERHAATGLSEGVAELAVDRLDEAFALEAAQIVAHLARGVLLVRDAEQLCNQGTEASVGDALGR